MTDNRQLSFPFDKAKVKGQHYGSGLRATVGGQWGDFGGDLDAPGGGQTGPFDFVGGFSDQSYEGASNLTPDLAGWQPFPYSGQSALTFARDRLANRLHQLIRDDGWAASAVDKHIDGMIGAGWHLQATPNFRLLGIDEDAADQLVLDIESAWKDYSWDFLSCDAAQTLPFGLLLALACRHWLIDGESTSLSLWLENRGKWNTAVQLIDPDRLSNPYLWLDTVNRKHGVELDSYGAPQAYWFRSAHPGDLGVLGAYPWRWERVERFYPNGRWKCVHSFVPKRAGQKSGEPPLAPILRKVQMIRKYDAAELQAAVLNALMAMFVQSPNDPEQVLTSLEGGGDELTEHQRSRLGYYERMGMKIPNVTMKFLFPNDTINAVNPTHPNANFEPFLKLALRNISSAAGITYEELTGDYSETNYSSARTAIMQVWRGITSRRSSFASIYALPHYCNWLEEAFEQGHIKYPKGAPRFRDARMAYSSCRWIGPPMGYVDPLKESQAAVMRMTGGLTSLARESAQQGTDWREDLKQQSREREEKQRLGIPVDQFMAPLPRGIKPNPNEAEAPERREEVG